MNAGDYSFDVEYRISKSTRGVEVEDRSFSPDDLDNLAVKIERGYAGTCGTRYPFANGDTYWCDDYSLGLRTHCVVISSNLHLCCIDTDGCYDQDDMKQWRW